MKIAIFGAGYVGYSLALFLADTEEITLIESDSSKISLINQSLPCLNDIDYKADLSKLHLKAVNYSQKIDDIYDYIIIAVPTDYDKFSSSLNTEIIENICLKLNKNTKSAIILKSTIPVGFTEKLAKLYPTLWNCQ